jgi:hypothetical protein
MRRIPGLQTLDATGEDAGRLAEKIVSTLGG